MMLEELSTLLASTPADADYDAYRVAIIDDNVLLKGTGSTRAKSFRYLRELYSLRSEYTIFRVMRLLWPFAAESKPLLALFCAIARDPLLRSTVNLIADTEEGAVVTKEDFSKAVQEQFGNRLNEDTLWKVGRNTASTWTQSGHLKGSTEKVRQLVQADSVATTYALFLGYLTGLRGQSLFLSPWAGLLDAPAHILHELAQQASQQGWLEYRQSGTITEISFHHFLKGA